MPIAAVAVAAVAVGEAVAVTTVFTVVAAVGATISAIGVLTGNKDLSLAGGALGVIGGVGALAQGAGLLGDDLASTFGSTAASSVSDATEAAQPLEGVTSEALPGSVGATGADAASGRDIIDQMTGAVSTNPATDALGQQIGAASGNANSLVANPDTTLGQSLNTSPASPAGAPAEAPTGGMINAPSPPAPPGAASAMAPGQATLPGAPASPSAPSVAAPAPPDLNENDLADWNSTDPAKTAAMENTTTAALAPSGTSPADTASGLSKFLDSRSGGAAVLGTIQAGGAFLTGAFSTLTPAQVAQANAQAALNNSQAALLQRQAGNMAQPIPVATRGSNASGLINSQAA